MKSSFSLRLVCFCLAILGALSIALKAYSTDIEEVTQDLRAYSIKIIEPSPPIIIALSSASSSSPAKIIEPSPLLAYVAKPPTNFDLSEATILEARVSPDPGSIGKIYWVSEGPSDPWALGNLGSKVVFWPTEVGSYKITAIFEKDGKQASDDGELIVIDVEIQDPKGSAEDITHSPESVITYPADPPYRYDFWAVADGSPKSYRIHFKGDIEPSEYSYQWSLNGAAGELDGYSIDEKYFVPPFFPEVAGLTLTAFTGDGVDTKVKDNCSVEVFEDHLARDVGNFNNQYCDTLQLSDVGLPFFNCHKSTMHAYDGSRPNIPQGMKWPFQQSPWEAEFPQPVSCEIFNQSAIELYRGDVVAYFISDTPDAIGNLAHSQTMKDGFFAWGANNIPETPKKYGSVNAFAYCKEMHFIHPKSFYHVQVYRKP